MSVSVQSETQELIDALGQAKASLSVQMAALLDVAIVRLEKYKELGDIVEEFSHRAGLHSATRLEEILERAHLHVVESNL